MTDMPMSAAPASAPESVQGASDHVITDILDVATREFAAHGLAGARIEKIVQQTRTSKRMIYYHFGSKEGLYRAVLERAFELVREGDRDFDPMVGSPEQAIRQIALNAFNAFTRNPAFVRLLTFENLAGAPFIQHSTHASRLNRLAMADLETVLHRGQAEGCIRQDIKALDVYITMVGLCYYHVAHKAAYVTADFQPTAPATAQGDTFDQQRQRAIQDTCWRYIKSD